MLLMILFRVLAFSCLISFVVPAYSQLGFEYAGNSRNIAIGRSGVTLSGISALYHNQALILGHPGWAFEGTVLRKYNLSDLNMVSLGGVYSRVNDAIGLSMVQYGFDSYKEQKIGLAYARKLIDQFSVGAQFDFLHLNITEYGSKSFFTFEIGIFHQVTKNISLGAHIYSPTEISINENDQIPARFRIGPKISVANGINTFLELEKVIGFDPVIKGGLSFLVEDNFSVMLGIQPSTAEFSFGFSYHFTKDLYLDSAFNYHQSLGLSPAIGVRKESRAE